MPPIHSILCLTISTDHTSTTNYLFTTYLIKKSYFVGFLFLVSTKKKRENVHFTFLDLFFHGSKQDRYSVIR